MSGRIALAQHLRRFGVVLGVGILGLQLAVGPQILLMANASGLQPHQRFLEPCRASQSSCVSSSAVSAPSKYLPPWGYPGTLEQAMKRLAEAIEERGGEVVEQEGLFLKARIPYAGSILKAGGFDSIDFLFVPSCNTVTFRSTASVDTAPQPFCVTPGCVNGPPNRSRLEELRDTLDWISLETDEEKEWVQILLH